MQSKKWVGLPVKLLLERKGRLSGDDGDEMMIQDDVTGEHGRNVRN